MSVLRSLGEAEHGLAQAVAAGSLLPDERLRPSTLQSQDFGMLERELSIALPIPERELLLKFDFNGLSVGLVTFGQTARDYVAYLIGWNSEKEAASVGNAWWWPGDRPPSKILIATAESWAVLLDTTTRQILAFLNGTPHSAAEVVAMDLEHFLRGVATVRLDCADSCSADRCRAIACEAGAAPGGVQFWRELVQQQQS